MATRPTLYPEHATTDVTLPVNGVDNKIRPDSTIRDVGWDQGQKPTAPELNWQLNNLYDWIVWLDQEEQDLPNNYYNKTELDGGQLDNRYYTETEIDTNHYTKSAADTRFANVSGDTFTGPVQVNDTLGVTGAATMAAVSATTVTASGNVIINGTPSASTHAATLGLINSKTFISGEIAITADTRLSALHGLGVRPYDVSVFLLCKTAESTFSVGDLVKSNMAFFNDGTANQNVCGIMPHANSTTVYATTGAVTSVIDSSGNRVNITLGNWRVIIVAQAALL